MRTSTGWKLSDIQWAFTLFILFQTWVQPAQGFLIDRLGPRLFTTIAGVLCGIGWTGLGMATTLSMLYALYVIAGIGAALISPIADVMGRRTVVILSVLIMSIGMLASAATSNVTELWVCRFATGLGIGGVLATCNTLLAEYAPSRWRDVVI